MAAVSAVLPWSMWPMVPTLMCGLVRTNFCLAIRRFLLFSQLGLALRPSLAHRYHILSWSQPLLAADFPSLCGRVCRASSSRSRARAQTRCATEDGYTLVSSLCCPLSHIPLVEPTTGLEPVTPFLPRTCSTC